MTAFDRQEAERAFKRLSSEAIEDDDAHVVIPDHLAAALVEIDRLTRRAQVAEMELDAARPVLEAMKLYGELVDSSTVEAADLVSAIDAMEKTYDAWLAGADERNDRIARIAAATPA